MARRGLFFLCGNYKALLGFRIKQFVRGALALAAGRAARGVRLFGRISLLEH